MSKANWVVMRYGMRHPYHSSAIYVDWYDTEQEAIDAAKDEANDPDMEYVDVLEKKHSIKGATE